MNVMDLDRIDVDAPIFDPDAFGFGYEETALNALARKLGRSRFAKRAAAYDRDARFPTENYRDLREAGLLTLCVPQAHGGLGAGFRAYATTAAEIGRYCAATSLTWNMHTCSCLWPGALADDLDMDAEVRQAHRRRRALHYRRIVEDGALYAQPFSEGGAYDGATGVAPFVDHGAAGRRRLDCQRPEDLRLARRRGGPLRHLVRRSPPRRTGVAARHALSRGPGNGAGRRGGR